jgi:hypothetical protein
MTNTSLPLRNHRLHVAAATNTPSLAATISFADTRGRSDPACSNARIFLSSLENKFLVTILTATPPAQIPTWVLSLYPPPDRKTWSGANLDDFG